MARSLALTIGALGIAASLVVMLGGCSSSTAQTLAPVSDPRPAGVVRDPIDPSQQTEVPFGTRSHWLQPWRGYLDTPPAVALRDGLGINFNVEPNEAEATARLLASAGFRRARIEVGWGSFSYSDPTRPARPGRLRTMLLALRRHGLRPLILLNSNQGVPCPTQFFDVTVVTPARSGDRRIRLDPASAAAVVPGRTGLNAIDEYKAADILFTAVAGDGWVTLSKPLPRDVEAGRLAAATLLYAPFGSPRLADGTPNPAFESALTGWLLYVGATIDTVHDILGSYDFDVEIWNELTFGSDFLDRDTYYDPAVDEGTGDVTDELLRRTVAWIRSPARGLQSVGIGNGFASQRPWDAGSTSPPGLTAIDKHPYQGPRAFPTDAMYSSILPLDALGRPDGDREEGGVWRDRFVPTYDSFFPEYSLTAIQTESLVRDLSPITSQVQGTDHGRVTHPPGAAPPVVWITEWNMDPGETGAGQPAGRLTRAERRLQAEAVLRFFVAYINKGAAAVYFYAAKGDRLGLIEPAFFEALERHPGRYPGESVGGESIDVLRRLTREVAGRGDVATRRLSVTSIGDYAGRKQFDGDGTPEHPALYDRDVLAFLPFQVTRSRFVVAAYVMTRDIRKALPAERYRLTVQGLGSCAVRASAADPLDGSRVPVHITGCGESGLVVELALTSSPRLLRLERR
jgi:hypothetical protein